LSANGSLTAFFNAFGADEDEQHALGGIETAVATGKALRHDGSSCFLSEHYQVRTTTLAIPPSHAPARALARPPAVADRKYKVSTRANSRIRADGKGPLPDPSPLRLERVSAYPTAAAFSISSRANGVIDHPAALFHLDLRRLPCGLEGGEHSLRGEWERTDADACSVEDRVADPRCLELVSSEADPAGRFLFNTRSVLISWGTSTNRRIG